MRKPSWNTLYGKQRKQTRKKFKSSIGIEDKTIDMFNNGSLSSRRFNYHTQYRLVFCICIMTACASALGSTRIIYVKALCEYACGQAG